MPFKTNTYIRRADREDLDQVVRWMEEPDFRQFLYGDAAHAPQRIREQIITMLGRSAGHTMPHGIYLMIDSPEDGPIGMLSLQNISWRNRSCSMDIYIGAKEKRNRFVAAIAMYRAEEYCFNELNLHRAKIIIYAFNTTSWRIVEKSGAKRELTLKEHIIRDGIYQDVYLYGLLRSDFEAFQQENARKTQGLSLQAMIESLAEAAEKDERKS